MQSKAERKAVRRFWLQFADSALTVVIGYCIGYTWGVVPALLAVLICTAICHKVTQTLSLN